MYYEYSIQEIRNVIKKVSPSVISSEAKLVPGILAPFSHLLWMCDQVQVMDKTSIDFAVRAGRWMGWVFAYLEMHAIFSNAQIRDMVRADRTHGFDKPH